MVWIMIVFFNITNITCGKLWLHWKKKEIHSKFIIQMTLWNNILSSIIMNDKHPYYGNDFITDGIFIQLEYRKHNLNWDVIKLLFLFAYCTFNNNHDCNTACRNMFFFGSLRKNKQKKYCFHLCRFSSKIPLTLCIRILIMKPVQIEKRKKKITFQIGYQSVYRNVWTFRVNSIFFEGFI